MASYDDNDKLGVWGDVGELEQVERPAKVMELMQVEEFLEGVASQVFKNMMSGCSMCRLQKMGKTCIRSSERRKLPVTSWRTGQKCARRWGIRSNRSIGPVLSP